MDSSLIKGDGIVLDIDETLSDTVGGLVSGLQKNFGNPEGLSAQEIIDKYRYTWNVPYWQSEEALAWVKKTCHSNENILALPTVKGAASFVNKIHEVVPIVGYVTARPQEVLDGTKKWLEKHGFPEAPVICRPEGTRKSNLNKWKARVLRELHPKVKGIVDDNVGLTDHLENYDGDVFLFNVKSSEKGVACVDWEMVYEEIKKRFG